jgi:hypothetical protein
MSLVLNVEILGEFKKLTAATQGANKQLSGLQGTAKKISSGIGKAFATIGVGLSFAFISRELEQASKAAVQDAKSQGLLATALKNTTKASNAQIASVEKSIGEMSIQAAVADDELRPAFAQLARATGDVSKSTKLMSLALDVAAGTGKSLDVVVKALSRAVGPDGTTGALERLAPAIKGANDPLAELERLFAGSAEKAANLDPYQRLNVALGEISESLGTLVVPFVESFAKSIVAILPKIQKFFAELTNPTTETGKKWQGMINVLDNTGKQFTALMSVFSGAGPSQNMLMDWVTSLTAGLGQIAFYLTRLAELFKALMALDFAKIGDLAGGFGADYSSFVAGQNQALQPKLTKQQQAAAITKDKQNVTININKGNVTAQEIAKAVNKGAKTTGSGSISPAALRKIGAR